MVMMLRSRRSLCPLSPRSGPRTANDRPTACKPPPDAMLEATGAFDLKTPAVPDDPVRLHLAAQRHRLPARISGAVQARRPHVAALRGRVRRRAVRRGTGARGTALERRGASLVPRSQPRAARTRSRNVRGLATGPRQHHPRTASMAGSALSHASSATAPRSIAPAYATARPSAVSP